MINNIYQRVQNNITLYKTSGTITSTFTSKVTKLQINSPYYANTECYQISNYIAAVSHYANISPISSFQTTQSAKKTELKTTK